MLYKHRIKEIYEVTGNVPEDLEKGLVNPESFTVIDLQSNESVGWFTLCPMPGNCGMVVSTGTRVRWERRGRGLSYVLHEAKEELSRALGYTKMISTVQSFNDPQIISAKKSGWREVDEFTNKRTNNDILIMVKDLK